MTNISIKHFSLDVWVVSFPLKIYLVLFKNNFSCFMAFYNILLSLTQTCFHPAHILTPRGAYNAYCHYKREALLKHIAIASYQVLIFLWMSEPVAT